MDGPHDSIIGTAPPTHPILLCGTTQHQSPIDGTVCLPVDSSLSRYSMTSSRGPSPTGKCSSIRTSTIWFSLCCRCPSFGLFFLFGREQLGRRHRQDKKVDRSFSFWRRLTRSTNNKNNNKRTNIWGVFSGLLWQNCWLGEWKRGNTNKILDISNWCEIQSRTAILFKLNVYTTVGQQERIALINSALQTVGAFPLSSRSND